jgi:hypothetical protein
MEEERKGNERKGKQERSDKRNGENVALCVRRREKGRKGKKGNVGERGGGG